MAKKKSKIKTVNTKRAGLVNYPVGDFLIRLKNITMAKRRRVQVPSTKLVEAVAKALLAEGYLDEVKKEDGVLNVRVTYKKKEPLIMDVKVVSKPGLRVYMSVDEIKKIKGPYRMIISTSEGIMTTDKALKKNLGGEIIAEIL